MKIEGAYITGTHPYSFRCGKPGLITGVKMVSPHETDPPRACYEITYEDMNHRHFCRYYGHITEVHLV